jgi:hypothetical protein
MRTITANIAHARVRRSTAEAYLDVADMVLGEESRPAMTSVAAGLAVLAGIASADAICARRLGQIHRGDDHRSAAGLLERAVPDGKKLAATFLRLVDIKDEAHYGLIIVTPARARSAVRWAQQLLARAQEELDR